MGNEINSLMAFDAFIVDVGKKVLWYSDEPVELPLKAVELLCALIEGGGEVVSKAELLDKVWHDAFVEEGVLSQNVYQLRKTFKHCGVKSDLIQTIPRRGYRFLGELKEFVEEEISIEHSHFERKVVTEQYVSDREYTRVNASLQKASSATNLNDIPRSDSSSSSVARKVLAGLAIMLVSLFLVGGGIWFWRSSGSNRRNFSRVAINLELTRITESGKAYFPAVSRDEKHLAYIRNEQNTYSVILQNLATKSETVVVGPKEYQIMCLNFSNDGNFLFYVTREKENLESTIYQIPIYGGVKRKILANVRHFFSISPDGKRLAFFRYNPKEDETYLMTSTIEGNGERIIARRKHPHFFSVWETYPAWSPDGRKLVVSGVTQPSRKEDSDRKSYFLEIEIKTGKEKRLNHPDWNSVHQAFWLNDGSGLVASAREGLNKQLWHLSYPDGKATRITNDTNNYGDFKLTSDTNSIFVENISDFYNLYTISTNEPEKEQQLTRQNLSIYGLWGMDWAENGKYLVYVKSDGLVDGNLWKMNLETLESEQLTFDSKLECRYPNITPDGKSIVFASNRSGNRQIWQIDLDGKNLKQVTDGKDGANYPEISKDGKWLFYNTPGTGPVDLWKKPLNSGRAVKILHNAGGVSRVSPVDSNQIVAHHYDPNEVKKPWKYVLFSHDTKGHLIPLNIDPERHFFEWNSEGTGVYYSNKSRGQNSLWFLPIKENSPQKIATFSDQKIANLSVSPDGKTIALSRGSSTSNILKIANFH